MCASDYGTPRALRGLAPHIERRERASVRAGTRSGVLLAGDENVSRCFFQNDHFDHFWLEIVDLDLRIWNSAILQFT